MFQSQQQYLVGPKQNQNLAGFLEINKVNITGTSNNNAQTGSSEALK
jgi:hypothetical protein